MYLKNSLAGADVLSQQYKSIQPPTYNERTSQLQLSNFKDYIRHAEEKGEYPTRGCQSIEDKIQEIGKILEGYGFKNGAKEMLVELQELQNKECNQ